MMIDYKHLVCVRCITYNHAPFIQDALNGFCTQNTTFPFVCVIIDDASIDGEQFIINSYLTEHFDLEGNNAWSLDTDEYKLIYARHKENKNCFFAVYLLKYNHYQVRKSKLPYFSEWDNRTKYIAICEGDDYWIDSCKIQKQVDFMETHPDYGMCYCNYRDYNEETSSYKSSETGSIKGISDLLLKNSIASLTTLFRSDLYYKYIEEIAPRKRGWKMSDYPRWIWMELESAIHYIDDVVAVYRTLPESASHSKDYKKRLAFIESSRDIRLFFAEKYSLGEGVKNMIDDVYWRERSRVLKGKDNRAYFRALKNIRNKSFREELKAFFSFFLQFC